ncbi:MAG: hypothetical protein ACFFEF_13410 [Candidatus Thorarchaeota archaeon]
MSEEDIRRIVEEATKEAMKQSYTEAGVKFLEAARASEQKGDFAGSENLQRQAGENFWKAANEYRASKSFKAAAINMCKAGDVYSELGDADNATRAYEQGAYDLYGASAEHLMWGEDAETKKGTALAVTGSMLLLMIGRDSDAFAKSRKFAAENASRLRFPGVVRLSQIPQMLESAIGALDLTAFADAETAAVTELKAALAGANAHEFNGYVDKGVEMVREILRGKLKVPKISSQLELPIDMTFKEEFPIRAIIENKGEGSAKNVKLEWHIDDGLKVLSGDAKSSSSLLKPEESIYLELQAKAIADMEGSREYSILVRGTYSDDLNTEYTLQVGPGTFILKDFKETEKLMQDVDVTEGRISLLYPSIDSSSFEAEPLLRVVSALESYLATARSEIDKKELGPAKARISVVNSIVDNVDSLLADETLKNQIEKRRAAEKQEYAKELLASAKKAASLSFDDEIMELDAERDTLFAHWDEKAESRKTVWQTLKNADDRVSELIRKLQAIQSEMPSAATTDDPTLAATRTKIRTSLETLGEMASSLRLEIGKAVNEPAIASKDRPDEHPKIAKAKESLESARRAVNHSIDSLIGEP